MLLHSQHDALHKHIEHITVSVPCTPTTSRSPTREASLSSSPESPQTYLSASTLHSTPHLSGRNHQRSSISTSSPAKASRPRMIKRRSSLPAIIDEEEILSNIEREEGKLHDVNEQIKCTLTDLLNCESVKNDNRYRMWVQQRLMNTEKELKSDRVRSCERKRRMSDTQGLSGDMGGDWA